MLSKTTLIYVTIFSAYTRNTSIPLMQVAKRYEAKKYNNHFILAIELLSCNVYLLMLSHKNVSIQPF
jgi:hypothetical protein